MVSGTSQLQWISVISSVLLLMIFGFVKSEEYMYSITPSPSDPCTTEHCLTLSQFAANSSNYLASDTTLIFAPGNHSLDSELIIENAHSLSMFSEPSSCQTHPIIVCSQHARFEMINVTVVTVSGFDFDGCVGNRVESVDQFQLIDSSFHGQAKVNDSYINNNRNASLDRDPFISNEQQEIFKGSFVMTDGAIVSVRSSITITQSWFEGNSARIGGALYSEQSSITIINSTFARNEVLAMPCSCNYTCSYSGGGTLHVGSGSTVNIIDSKFVQNSVVACGGVLYIPSPAYHVTMNIIHSQFVANIVGCYGAVLLYVSALSDKVNIAITHSKFINNHGIDVVALFGGEVTIAHNEFINNNAVEVVGIGHSTSVTFAHNEFISNNAVGVVVILHSTSVTVAHNEFINNNASTLQLREVVGTINSTSVIVAHNEFVNNNDKTMKDSLCRQLDHKKLVLGVVVNILNSTSVIIAHNEFVNSIALYVVHSYQTTTLQESCNEFMENNVVYDVFVSPRCRPGYDYSLGSSHCVECPDHWHRNLIGIAIAAIVAGFVLVAFILALNMTIAVGTLNGILFYANIVFANADTYLPYSTPNFASVLISWLNLDIGFNVCFFEGMDNTDKPLIQLAFPAYVIFLVVMVIIISECSSNFSRLIGRGNPVAALATMILLSYAKLFNVIIAGSVIMLYGNPSYGSRNLDVRKLNQDGLATILEGKHIALIVFGALILLLGIPYTALVFSWQWLLRYQETTIFKWVRYQKLQHFMESHNAPYTPKYRYWTGMLLLVRVLLFSLSALNFSRDSRQDLVSTVFVVGFLILVKGLTVKRIYQEWPIDLLETIMYFNLVSFAAFTWYTLESGGNQTAVAYTSVMIMFIFLLAVIVFHAVRYTRLYNISVVQKTLEWISAKLSVKEYEHETAANDQMPEEIDGYQVIRGQDTTVTCTVVEISHRKPVSDQSLTTTKQTR